MAHDIKATISQTILVCDCCGKSDLLRTVEFHGANLASINLGVVCAGNLFRINMRGAPLRAVKHLQSVLNEMTEDEIIDVLDEISFVL